MPTASLTPTSVSSSLRMTWTARRRTRSVAHCSSPMSCKAVVTRDLCGFDSRSGLTRTRDRILRSRSYRTWCSSALHPRCPSDTVAQYGATNQQSESPAKACLEGGQHPSSSTRDCAGPGFGGPVPGHLGHLPGEPEGGPVARSSSAGCSALYAMSGKLADPYFSLGAKIPGLPSCQVASKFRRVIRQPFSAWTKRSE